MPSSTTIQISNAQTMGMKSRFELFGGTIAFKRVTEYSMSCAWGNISNAYGQMISLDEIETLKNTEDYNSFVVNGKTINRAKFKSFNLQSGPLNKLAMASFTLETQSSGDIMANLDGYYKDYKAAFGNGTAFVDEISESINLSKGEDSIDFSKQIDIKFSNSVLFASNEMIVKAAQSFAKKMFDYDAANGYADTVPNLETEGSGEANMLRKILNGEFKKFTTETIDAINNKCTFVQSLRAENIKEGGGVDYSHSATQSISIEQSGVVTVTEEGKIQALTGFYAEQSKNAETAFLYEVDQARARMEAIFAQYYECGTPELNEKDSKIMFLSTSKNIDPFRGTISYTVKADNDPKNSQSGSGVRSENVLSYSVNNGIWTVTEKGTVEALKTKFYDGTKSGLARYVKFTDAYGYYSQTVSGGVASRISAFAGQISCPTLSAYPISRAETHGLLKGTVQYERVYSSDPKYAQNDVYKSISTSSSTDYEFMKKNEFQIINKPIFIQETKFKELGKEKGSQQISTKILGYRVDPAQGRQVFDAFKEDVIANGGPIKSKIVDGENYCETAQANFQYMNDVSFDLSVTLARGMEDAT